MWLSSDIIYAFRWIPALFVLYLYFNGILNLNENLHTMAFGLRQSFRHFLCSSNTQLSERRYIVHLRLHNTSWLSQNDIGHASRLIPNLAPNLIYRELIVHVVARCAVCGVCMAGTACRSCFRCLLRFTFKWKLCDLLVNSYSGNKCFRVAVSFNC